MRGFSLYVAIAAIAAAFGGAPASAKSKGVEARVIMKSFAACTVKRAPRIAVQFVVKQPDERLPERDFQKLVSSNCLAATSPFVASLKMRSTLFRGALAEELVRVEMIDQPTIDPASVPPLVWSDPVPPSPLDDRGRPLSSKAIGEREAAYAVALADIYVGRLGECAVRADPGGAKAVLLTGIDAAEELAAMKAMATTIATCVRRGETLKFNRTTLRAAMAISYYLLGVAERASQKAGG